jgi:hypothetical protein
MAESTALFFALLAVWMMMRWQSDLSTFTGLTRTWIGKSALIGVGIGLAVSGKQTGLALWPIALVILGLTLGRRHWREALILGGTVTLSCGLLFWALNPILYRSPLAVAQAMVEARADLVQRQIADTEALFPQALTLTPIARVRAALLELYLRPLAFSDIPIYTEDLAPSIQAYDQQLAGQLRHPELGALSLGLTLVGLLFSGLRLGRLRRMSAEGVCWLWGGATLALILVAIPLDWQRYFLPLAPVATLFTALGLEALILPFWRTRAIMKPSGDTHEIRHHRQ